MFKQELNAEEKKNILNKNLDIIYKFCHNNRNKYKKYYENFESFISDCIVFSYECINNWDFNKGALSTYLYNTLPWQIINKNKRENSGHYESLESILEMRPDTEFEGLFGLDNQDKERDERLLKFIYPLLHPFTKEHYLKGKSYRELAEKYADKSATSIKLAVYENLKDIKQRVNDEFED